MTAPELSKAYEPAEVEARWNRVWLERQAFRADPTSKKPPFSMILPPPNVTGSLHLGHALTATVQDILCRWKRMTGHDVLWLPGIDHAGIATQMIVEKELKQSEGKSRHDLGRPAFLERVWKWKEKYGQRIGEQHKVLGASLDWSRERFTMDEQSSRAVREVFVRLHEEGLIYRAQKLINWCPSCHTALSDLEVEHDEQKKGSLWHIRYPVTGTDRFLTVATTRPETMLGDTAVAIHPDDPRYAGLAGKTVTLPLVGREIPIITDAELVNMEFGTGVVKVTPAHDFNDYQTGLRHELPMISIFDDDARTNKEAGAYAGLDRYEARRKVLEDLTAQELLEKEEPHLLSIGTCQRCYTVVEPRLSPQWFVKIEPLATPAIRAVEQGKTRFVPEQWTNTYFTWMRNIHDWCISRQLWWGHQIPAYYCNDCSPRKGEDGGGARGIDYARAEPLVRREPPEKCPKCGGSSFERDPDVLDTWFSSALWPFSTLGWPNNTVELNKYYPTSVMETGHDIIFFWIARMMMMGLHFMKDVPFHTVFLHAMVRDEKGEKMSKTKGNVIDPLDVILGAKPEQLLPAVRNKFPQGMPAFGADALRFTLAALTQQGRDIKLSLDRVAGYKAFTNKLWNASRFALMNLGEFRLEDPDAAAVKALPLSLADRWILSRLDRTVEETGRALEAFQFSDAANAAYQFVWGELCDWYIELAKSALYGEDERAKQSTRAVLVFCLDRTLRLLHPFMPFITEEIWEKLPMKKGVALVMSGEYPRPDPRLRDEAAEAELAPVIAAIEGLRTIRGESNLSPGLKLTAHIQSSDAGLRATLEKWRGYLIPLAGLSEVEIGPPGARPPMSATHVGSNLELFVPLAGLIDLDEERGRLKKEIIKADGELAALRKKHENPNFLARAPKDVVEKDQARIAELEAKRSKLQENLNRIAPEGSMSEEKSSESSKKSSSKQTENGVAAPMKDADTARVKIAPPVEPTGGGVDLGEELKAELEAVSIPEQVDPQVKDALEKLREGTKEGLSPTDHYDLGVAYMGMGLVDDAVREFNAAKEGEDSEDEGAARKAGAKAGTKKAGAKKPAAKKPAPKKPAAKKPAAKKPAAKKPAAKKPAAKKPAAKKPAAKKAGAKKLAAKKPSAKKPAAAKAGARKPAGKKAGAAKKAGAKGAKAGAARKAGARKPAAKKAPAKKASAKKSAAKKPAAKKAPAKKSVGKKPAAKKSRK